MAGREAVDRDAVEDGGCDGARSGCACYPCAGVGVEAMISQKTSARFWAKVDRQGENECWPWTARRGPKGYGEFQLRPKVGCRATHVALLLAGFDRPDGAMALHSCDNPPCCNPKHLRWGTAAENAADRDDRGRFSAIRGESRTTAKLTEASVVAIMTDSRGYATVARAYGVSKSLIANIRKGKAWTHVTGL